ncbi:pyruvate formate lyase-activating protein [Paenibacillus glucanolyticus]|jgi:pyruvate formate lyase activating enzyme|uniref:pyruvate formate-lyase-activating protein n=1 Tax=Paenibacillus TaxID=44249 RepID=UPI0003E20522|nr:MULTISPECIES: pyruvate formate-lyase-activating protein [Paenibacillus]ANA81914.1 pyruvate formate-lyase 1-activating enzyme [Paenibacillus glucanolyticus]AVV59353.1 pyruvate formate lyase-activating protein [Paenibacillus glucanolyticus]ETT43339.1 pyruvate formate-lyase activating enzyme [Paenibacillus sp. FSL R5-808]MPY16119.1 pyruvate formate lyase-activating protein [Paenibacillus glucanolyticus]
MLKGHIHSIETFGTVDGPGIRFVLFMQGCLLKCQYCHNPDTWGLHEGQEMTVEDVLAQIEPYLSYYRSSGGGLTVSGGEPTLQYPFVTELFKEVKRRWNLHTTLDSNGYNEPEKISELLEHTDLVLLDLKHINDEKHIKLTGKSNERTLKTARWLSHHGRKMWVRHVYVPGIHDSEHDLRALGQFIRTLQGVDKFEILPYHQMGVYKWKEHGMAYPLEGVPSPSEEEIARAYQLIGEAAEQK